MANNPNRKRKKKSSSKKRMNNPTVNSLSLLTAGHSNNSLSPVSLAQTSTSPTTHSSALLSPAAEVDDHKHSHITTPDHLKQKKLPSFPTNNINGPNHNTTTHSMTTTHTTTTTQYKSTIPVFLPMGFKQSELGISSFQTKTISFTTHTSKPKPKIRYHRPSAYNKPLPSLQPRRGTFDDGLLSADSDHSDNDSYSISPRSNSKHSSAEHKSKERRNSAPATPVSPAQSTHTISSFGSSVRSLGSNGNPDYSHMLKDAIKPAQNTSVPLGKQSSEPIGHTQPIKRMQNSNARPYEPKSVYTQNAKGHVHANSHISNVNGHVHSNSHMSNMNGHYKNTRSRTQIQNQSQYTNNQRNKPKTVAFEHKESYSEQFTPPSPTKIDKFKPSGIMLPSTQSVMILPGIKTRNESKESEESIEPIEPVRVKERVRRNSDTIVYTPTNSHAVNDCSFMDKIETIQPPLKHRRSQYGLGLDKGTMLDLNIIDETDMKGGMDSDENSDSESVIPIPSLPTVAANEQKTDDFGKKRESVKDLWFVANATKRYEENRKYIRTMLGFDNNKGWDFDNDYVEIYHKQCSGIKYESYVPPLKHIIYPTMLSSLALRNDAQKMYTITVKYCLKVLIKDTYIKDSTEYETELQFDNDTTVQSAIESVMLQIEARQEHQTHLQELLALKINCFILKVGGAEQYLRNDITQNESLKIISLAYVRNQIRQSNLNNTQLILLYDSKLSEYDSKKYKAYSVVKHSKETMALALHYQLRGYNCICDTIKETINDGNIGQSLERLNESISDEILYIQKQIPSIHNSGAQTSVAVDTPSFMHANNEIDMNEMDSFHTDWNGLNNESIRLSEFDHEIVFNIKSLKNMVICPRFTETKNKYFTYILRIELMFGAEVFPQCSWDIRIPPEFVSENIQMPKEHCTFSTKSAGLFYSSLPRESVWCFTLYGIKKDVSIEQELQKKEKQKHKKQRKNEPKILKFSDTNTKKSKRDSKRNSHNISSKTIVESEMIRDDNINDFYNSKPSTTRSHRTNSSFPIKNTLFEEKEVFESEPLAYCKLPMIDNLHRLRKKEYNLHLWQVPVYHLVKGGPKIDPYSTNTHKKFGSVRECALKKNNKLNSVILCIDFLLEQYEFDIIAPIVNQRRPHYIRTQIKPVKRHNYSNVLYDIIQRDGIFPLDERDKMLMYSNKEKLMLDSSAIPTFLRSVKWLDMPSRMEAYDYLEKWSEPSNPEDMIELLRYEFADNRIRLYAINCLNKLDDYSLSKSCLLQLVQALKHEAHHISFLSRFLMIRALNSPFQIGHYLYYHLKSEYDSSLQWKERYGLLLEELLSYLPYYPHYPSINLCKEFYAQHNLINKLKFISLTIQNYKKTKKINKKGLMNLLHNELARLNTETQSEIRLPLNPSYKVGKIITDKCRFMSSAKMPLWLVFENGDSNGEVIETMFKCGDDLRQDILTLQLMSIMDSFWLKKNIDLNMRTYQVIGTGFNVGFIELVLDSKTTNSIGSISTKSHLKYVTKKRDNTRFAHLSTTQKSENYSRSVAGFSVATWVLGIGDRHPDNIMIHKNGTLFHIDFGHFLGNFKEKDIGLVKWKREKTPFVFTKCMKYCIENAGENKNNSMKKQQNYAQFVRWLFAAYMETRIRYKFLLNLLLLMVPSQMPELITESDVSFFREELRFDLSDHESIASHVENTLKFCLADKSKKLDDFFHKIKHS